MIDLDAIERAAHRSSDSSALDLIGRVRVAYAKAQDCERSRDEAETRLRAAEEALLTQREVVMKERTVLRQWLAVPR